MSTLTVPQMKEKDTDSIKLDMYFVTAKSWPWPSYILTRHVLCYSTRLLFDWSLTSINIMDRESPKMEIWFVLNPHEAHVNTMSVMLLSILRSGSCLRKPGLMKHLFSSKKHTLKPMDLHLWQLTLNTWCLAPHSIFGGLTWCILCVTMPPFTIIRDKFQQGMLLSMGVIYWKQKFQLLTEKKKSNWHTRSTMDIPTIHA